MKWCHKKGQKSTETWIYGSFKKSSLAKSLIRGAVALQGFFFTDKGRIKQKTLTNNNCFQKVSKLSQIKMLQWILQLIHDKMNVD